MPFSRAKIVITDLEIDGSPGGTQTFSLLQAGQTADDDPDTQLEVTFHSSVLEASFEADPDTPGAATELTLTFKSDAASANATDDPVTITLPAVYDLDVGNNGGGGDGDNAVVDEDVEVRLEGEASEGNSLDSVVSNDGDTVTVGGFAANKEITVTIIGLKNPTSTAAATVMFAHAGQDPAVGRTQYITTTEDLEIDVTQHDPAAAGAESDLSFNFVPLPIGDDEAIEISFATGYSVVESYEDEDEDGETIDVPNIKVYQLDDDDEEVALVFEAGYDDPDTNDNEQLTITIMGDDDDDGGVAVDPDLEEIYVDISNLTNSDTVGLITDAIVIQQGQHSVSMTNIRQTGTQISTTTAGASVRVRVSTLADARVPPGEDILVDMQGFVLPDTIEEDQVIVDGGDGTNDTRYYGPPSSISIAGGRWVTLSIPTSYPNGNPVLDGVPVGNIYTITFKSGAGVKNPTVVSGSRPVEANDQAISNTDTTVTSSVGATNAENPSGAPTPPAAIGSLSASSASRLAPLLST